VYVLVHRHRTLTHRGKRRAPTGAACCAPTENQPQTVGTRLYQLQEDWRIEFERVVADPL